MLLYLKEIMNEWKTYGKPVEKPMEKATDLLFILAGRWKMNFLQWSNPGRSTMPG